MSGTNAVLGDWMKKGVTLAVDEKNAAGGIKGRPIQIVTYDDMLGCAHEFAPTVDQLTADSPAPLQADSDGKYPIPEPGKKKQPSGLHRERSRPWRIIPSSAA